MKVSVYNQKAEAIGSVDLPERIYGVKPSSHLLAEAARILQSNARQGTSSTKTRGEVSGGGKKPWKQKGTGRARAGSIRSPIWRHGGIVFGPRANQNWELKLNKKAKAKALFMALSDKAAHGRFVVVDRIDIQPKTKEFVAVLGAFKKALKDTGKRHLLLLPKSETAITKASRNVPGVTPRVAATLSLLDVLKADTVFTLQDSLPVIERTFAKAAAKEASK